MKIMQPTGIYLLKTSFKDDIMRTKKMEMVL